ncbi:Signal recognition particle 9 kDa protein [Heterocephalus glaber]|uniref:Signal recognition particle 9 kDa protein n=1 Tax=Heterocephalus glaber TaxID=10181 RepID=G5C8W6_HETGA|nr:Signal recognition particle 9 kDa protein [Heterocephalus glaber]
MGRGVVTGDAAIFGRSAVVGGVQPRGREALPGGPDESESPAGRAQAAGAARSCGRCGGELARSLPSLAHSLLGLPGGCWQMLGSRLRDAPARRRCGTDQAQDVKKIEKFHSQLMRLMVAKESRSVAMETD